jgi:hypothetical protein
MPATTAYSAQPAAEHGRQKMKMKLEYDHSNPALFPAFDSQLEAKLRIDGPVIGTEVEQVWFGFRCLKGIASARVHPWVKAFQNDVTRFTKVNFFNAFSTKCEELSRTPKLRTKPYRSWGT